MVKKLQTGNVRNLNHASEKVKNGPGRPRSGHARPYLTVSVNLLRTCLNALETAAAETRNPSIKNQLMDAAHGVTKRLGPMADPAYKAAARPPQPKRIGWRVVLADGTEHRVGTVTKAAALLNLKESSLRVMLSQKGGRYSARRGDSVVTLDPILA